MASGSELDYATLAAHGIHRWVYIEPEMEQYDDYDYDDDDDDEYEPEQYEEQDDEDDGGFEREYTVDEDRLLLRTTDAMTHSFRSFAVDSTPRAPAAAASTTTTTLVAVDAKDGEDTCFVCLDKVPDCKFIDCNHGHICCICADRLIKGSGKCPLCRGVVTRYEVVDTTPDSWDN